MTEGVVYLWYHFTACFWEGFPATSFEKLPSESSPSAGTAACQVMFNNNNHQASTGQLGLLYLYIWVSGKGLHCLPMTILGFRVSELILHQQQCWASAGSWSERAVTSVQSTQPMAEHGSSCFLSFFK